MELISIILPIYNVEKYLNRAINSVVVQTYKKLEIILIDDGSTDKSSDICDEWKRKDARIQVVHQSNRGLSGARNRGIQEAKGKYIFLLDSDDYVSENVIEILYNQIINNNVDLAMCGFIKGMEEHYQFGNNDLLKAEIINGETAITRIYKDDVNALKYASACAKLYKRELFDGVEYPEGKLFEDMYTTHKILFKCNKIAVVNLDLVYYYQRQSSIMNTSYNIKKLDYLQALQERCIFFEANNLKELAKIAYEELMHALIWEYSRTRDILHNKKATQQIVKQYRNYYKLGYSSKRFPHENSTFLFCFNLCPELINIYWKLTGKFKTVLNKMKGI